GLDVRRVLFRSAPGQRERERVLLRGRGRRTLMSVGFGLRDFLPRPAPAPAQDDPLTLELLRRADEARAGGRPQEAGTLYRQILQTRRSHLGALRGCRELAVEAGEWRQVLDLQHRILGAVGATERARETEW